MTERPPQTTTDGAEEVHLLNEKYALNNSQKTPIPKDHTQQPACPMEMAFENMCVRYGIKFERNDSVTGLDFYLPSFNVYVEVKQFHSERIAEQMSRQENVIAIQGMRGMVALEKMMNQAWLMGDKNGQS